MSTELKTLLTRLKAEYFSAADLDATHLSSCMLKVDSCACSIIKNTTLEKLHESLKNHSLSADCYVCLYATIFSTVDPEWLLPDLFDILAQLNKGVVETSDLSINSKALLFSSIVDRICESACVREFNEKKEEYFTEDDFVGIADRAVCGMNALLHLVEKLSVAMKFCEKHPVAPATCRQSLTNLMHYISYRSLSVCLEHMSSQPWTSETSISVANALLTLVCSVNQCSNFEDYLCRSDCVAFKKILSELQPKLSPPKWRMNPSAPQVFSFCVQRVRMPFLSDQLGAVLSTPLLFVDDHEVHHQCLGLDIIEHIVKNSSRAELCWYGRADVLFDLMKKQLYSREVDVLAKAIPVLLAVLDVVERSPVVANGTRTEGKYDETFRIYVRNMSLETTIAVRRVYARHLAEFIKRLGITILRHLEPVLEDISAYLEVFDGPAEECRFSILRAIQMLILHAWPRIAAHGPMITQILVRFVYDISSERTVTPADINSRLLDEAVRCLQLLKQVCPDKMDELLTDLRNLNMNDTVNVCIDRVKVGGEHVPRY